MQLYHKKMTMQSLCYLDLPWLCLGTLYNPSVTMGDPSQPHNSKKQAQNHQIFLCPFPTWLVCSCIIVKMTRQSLCYLDLSRLCLGTVYHPFVTIGDPLTALKWPKTCPKSQIFLCPPLTWLVCSCIIEISSLKASNSQRFPFPALLFLVFMGGSRAVARIGDEVL